MLKGAKRKALVRAATAIALAFASAMACTACAAPDSISTASSGLESPQYKSGRIIEDLKARGLYEHAEGVSALEVANRDEELKFSYVWTGDDGTRWCIYVTDEGIFATPVGHDGKYVYTDIVLGEGGEPTKFVQTGTGSSDIELVKVDAIDADALNKWSHENIEGFLSVPQTVPSEGSSEAQGGEGAPRAPTGEERVDE